MTYRESDKTGFILVVSPNSNIRKFYIDNFTVRGYPALGVPTLQGEHELIFEHYAPEVVLMWGEVVQLQADIEKVRRDYAFDVPVILVSSEKPAPEWMEKWRISTHISCLSDSRQLIQALHPWLEALHAAK